MNTAIVSFLMRAENAASAGAADPNAAVSYTHLTLPTSLIV